MAGLSFEQGSGGGASANKAFKSAPDESAR